MIRLDVRNRCSSYLFSSPLKVDAVVESWCNHRCDSPRSYSLAMGQLHTDTVII